MNKIYITVISVILSLSFCINSMASDEIPEKMNFDAQRNKDLFFFDSTYSEKQLYDPIVSHFASNYVGSDSSKLNNILALAGTSFYHINDNTRYHDNNKISNYNLNKYIIYYDNGGYLKMLALNKCSGIVVYNFDDQNKGLFPFVTENDCGDEEYFMWGTNYTSGGFGSINESNTVSEVSFNCNKQKYSSIYNYMFGNNDVFYMSDSFGCGKIVYSDVPVYDIAQDYQLRGIDVDDNLNAIADRGRVAGFVQNHCYKDAPEPATDCRPDKCKPKSVGTDSTFGFSQFNVVPHIGTDRKNLYFDVSALYNDKMKSLVNYSFIDFQVTMLDDHNYFHIWDDENFFNGGKIYKCVPDFPFDFKHKYYPAANDATAEFLLGFDWKDVVVNLPVVDIPIGTKLKLSYITLDFTPCYEKDNVIYKGVKNTYQYDFLSRQGTLYKLDPEDDGGYPNPMDKTPEDSNTDYYQTIITKDPQGNPQYIYVYVDQDGVQHPAGDTTVTGGSVTIGDVGATVGDVTASVGDININIDTGGGSDGNYIDIDPVDYENMIAPMKELLQKDDDNGFFALLRDIYKVFPPQIWLIVGGGLSAVITVSIVKILRG